MDAVVAARAFFASQKLPFPPLPAHFEAKLGAVSEHLFATLPVNVSAFDLEVWADEVSASSAPLALLGVDGRGINSWAMHYYLVDGPLALFVQSPWGGAYDDEADARSRITRAFDTCAKLQQLVDETMRLGKMPARQRLLVVHSRLADPRCVWLHADRPPEPLTAPPGTAPLAHAIELFTALNT
jgi:hypothetical protein